MLLHEITINRNHQSNLLIGERRIIAKIKNDKRGRGGHKDTDNKSNVSNEIYES